MELKFVLFVVSITVLTWSSCVFTNPVQPAENSEQVDGEVAEDYTCGNLTCPANYHCELFLVECEKSHCSPVRKCVKTTGITCANVRCAGHCFMKRTCDESGCRDGPTCVPRKE